MRASLSAPGVPASVIVGIAPSTRTGPVLAAVPGGVFVAWAGPSGNILGRRVTIGSASRLVMGTPVTVGQGSEARPATSPQAGSFNQRVMVSWARCAEVHARVSVNGGASWAPARRLTERPCGEIASTPASAAVRQQNLAIGYRLSRPSGDRELVITSNDGFATQQSRNVTAATDRLLVGFVTLNDTIRLASLYDQSATIRFRRCSTTVCPPF